MNRRLIFFPPNRNIINNGSLSYNLFTSLSAYMFGLHIEDAGLLAGNELIYGLKCWFVIMAKSERGEQILADATGHTECNQYLKYKSLFMPLMQLAKDHPDDFEYTRFVQRPGDIVCLSNKSYHQGFATKPCLARATNYAPYSIQHIDDVLQSIKIQKELESKKGKKCECEGSQPAQTLIEHEKDILKMKQDLLESERGEGINYHKQWWKLVPNCEKGKEKYYCPNWSQCQVTCQRKHFGSHRQSCITKEKRWKCEECGKGFGRKCHLKEHSILHTGEKPYECDICKKKYASRSGLRSHKKKRCQRQ